MVQQSLGTSCSTHGFAGIKDQDWTLRRSLLGGDVGQRGWEANCNCRGVCATVFGVEKERMCICLKIGF